MPTRGSSAAPVFDKARPRELSRYFADLEILLDRAQVTIDAAMKTWAAYYIDFSSEQIWRTFPEFANPASTYQNFKDAVLAHYPDATGDYIYSVRDMDHLIGERQRIGISTMEDLADFHLQFLTMTTWLIEKKMIGPTEQGRAFLRAFQPTLQHAVNNRLEMKFTDQNPSIPHTIQEILDAARYLFQKSGFGLPSYHTPTPPPVTILRRPSPAIATPDPVIKTENIGALFSEFTKTIVEAMSKSMRGPPSNPQRSVDCNMCAGAHYMRDCPMVVEYTKAGKCRRNSEGRVCLPSGAYVSKEIPGTLLSERIDEWHRRFPNQLATATLLHTVAKDLLASPVITEIRSSYQLSTGDRIATLEAELFNLRARKTVAANAIRTRAQRARDSSPEIAGEEDLPVPTVRRVTPDIVTPTAPPVVIVPASNKPAPVAEENEHPYQKAKDASYAPPANRNVGALPKVPAYKKPEAAYKTLPPVHDPAIARDVYQRAMDTQVLVTQRELLSLSPEIRTQTRESTTTKRVPNTTSAQPQSFIVEVEDESEIYDSATFAFQATNGDELPPDAYIVPDPIESYYASLPFGEEPDIDRLTVAKDSTAIRSIYSLICSTQKIECTVDPGCQIIAMAETECHSLGLAYDPRIRLNMESANGTFDWSLGLARNVSFKISDITLYFQVHIIRSPSYSVLLGRPFDVLTESVIRNFANEDQTITITDPNSGKKSTIPTFPRGAHSAKSNSTPDF
jgi:hypothetical protein